MLRPLLKYAHEDAGVTALADAVRAEPQRAFVSASLRPYLLASLLDAEPERPALVVAGDDRAALDLLLGEQPAVVVASAAALAEKVPDPDLRPHGFAIEKGGLVDLDEVSSQLVACGYERVDQVEDRGQFAVRGDILDVYPATEERAVRCELFDIEVERLTWFSTFTQRSLEEAEGVEIAPALRHLWQDVTASFHDQDAHDLYVPPDRLGQALDRRAALRLSSISQDQPHEFRAQSADTAARSLREAEPELEKLVRSGYRTVVAWSRRGEAERARLNLARVQAGFLDGQPAPAEPGVLFAHAGLREGFLAPQLKLAVVPEHRLLRRRRGPRPEGPRPGALASFTDLRADSPVVHEDHGIARFAGFETKTVGGITRDYLELEFRDGDRVFVPSDQLHKISRYVGADASDPPLSKLGGKQWERMKLRARRAAEGLAGELITLYAERKRRAGHAFPHDSEWQMEFESAFPYRETPDQLEAIEAVRADMEEARPMDRLICGDVGYGKTEVALRGAFKAAADGKQVMFLVPTTVLAQQHYGTFTERLRDYPFTIEVASRFRSPKEVRAALAGFAEGKVDILIGTHRLLSRDVRPKDLGLLIVDEEQRFGVKQKELLRQLRLKVDVLSLSATPIPRTLQMSLAGLRDITVIETPPEGRRPVRTYVGEYDEELVSSAIKRELAREGQTFFLHNRVETIDETAERIRAVVPEARVSVAHGQMAEGQLERTMLSFLRGDGDVLVCTSIVESGLDIPTANTLIVERADTFGLAQLYQIRGRVGRSSERAYAYLLYPSAAALSEEASRRLATLSDYTELGSGFKIAMRDLEIRGAGNLLGQEQSGHVAAVGFELYCQMLEDAAEAMREGAAEVEELEPREPVRIEVDVDAYVPAEYVPFEAAK